jgi:hypothetical protein
MVSTTYEHEVVERPRGAGCVSPQEVRGRSGWRPLKRAGSPRSGKMHRTKCERPADWETGATGTGQCAVPEAGAPGQSTDASKRRGGSSVRTKFFVAVQGGNCRAGCPFHLGESDGWFLFSRLYSALFAFLWGDFFSEGEMRSTKMENIQQPTFNAHPPSRFALWRTRHPMGRGEMSGRRGSERPDGEGATTDGWFGLGSVCPIYPVWAGLGPVCGGGPPGRGETASRSFGVAARETCRSNMKTIAL